VKNGILTVTIEQEDIQQGMARLEHVIASLAQG